MCSHGSRNDARWASSTIQSCTPCCDGIAPVRRSADRTAQGALEDAISLLNACPNVQLLLNDAQFSPSGRRFGTYYGQGGAA